MISEFVFPKCCIVSKETAYINLNVFGLTQLRLNQWPPALEWLTLSIKARRQYTNKDAQYWFPNQIFTSHCTGILVFQLFYLQTWLIMQSRSFKKGNLNRLSGLIITKKTGKYSSRTSSVMQQTQKSSFWWFFKS